MLTYSSLLVSLCMASCVSAVKFFSAPFLESDLRMANNLDTATAKCLSFLGIKRAREVPSDPKKSPALDKVKTIQSNSEEPQPRDYLFSLCRYAVALSDGQTTTKELDAFYQNFNEYFGEPKYSWATKDNVKNVGWWTVIGSSVYVQPHVLVLYGALVVVKEVLQQTSIGIGATVRDELQSACLAKYTFLSKPAKEVWCDGSTEKEKETDALFLYACMVAMSFRNLNSNVYDKNKFEPIFEQKLSVECTKGHDATSEQNQEIVKAANERIRKTAAALKLPIDEETLKTLKQNYDYVYSTHVVQEIKDKSKAIGSIADQKDSAKTRFEVNKKS